MVTIIKLSRVEGVEWVNEINQQFKELHDLDIMEGILVRESDCGEFENLYIFFEQHELNTFINLLLEYHLTIHSKTDFTDELIGIILNNRINNFKKDFIGMINLENIINEFTLSHIGKDMILEKISKLGVDSLNKTDLVILEA